jgi:hypothetical protein
MIGLLKTKIDYQGFYLQYPVLSLVCYTVVGGELQHRWQTPGTSL